MTRPAENLERIFNRLSVCHGIITALGGDISVTSEVDRGTTFRVSLPVYETCQERRAA